MENRKESVLSNAVYLVLYRLLNVLLPLISSMYVARILTATGIGKVVYAQNIVTYFTLLASLGLPTYGTREIAKVVGDEDNYNKLFRELFWINAISTTICMVSYFSLCFIVDTFQYDLKLYLITGLSIVFNYFNIDWLYQGREEYKYISIRGSFVKLASIILMFLLVKETKDYVIYAAIQCMVLGGNNLINILGLRKRVKRCKVKLQLQRHLKPLLILFATNIAIELYTLLDVTMLGSFCEEDIVGYYSYAMRTSKIIITILVAATSVLLPKLSFYFETKNQDRYIDLAKLGFLFVIFTTIPCGLMLGMNSIDIITLLYGVDFLKAETTLKILSVLIVPITMSTYLGVQILCSRGKEKKMLIAVSAGAVVNVLLNSILIPQYHHNGAAVASVISEILVATIELIFAWKLIHIKVEKKVFLYMLFSIGMLIFVTIESKILFQSLYLRLLMTLGCGTFVYVIINLPIIKELWQQLRRVVI